MKASNHFLLKMWFVVIVTTTIVAWFVSAAAAEDPNKFNRLFKPPQEALAAIKDDGIHDPENPGLKLLQEPKSAFQPLDKSISGNYVNWGESLKSGKIKPLYDYLDASKKPAPMNLDVVMEVKGSMPDVVFPHGAHTELLDCNVCHPQLFVPQKGANQISMAQIMLGQSCGICHGSVAFPVTECVSCHPKQKAKKTAKKEKSESANKN